jgi:hypothetical protein
MKKVSLSLEPDDLRGMDKLCKSCGLTRTEVMRAIIRAVLGLDHDLGLNTYSEPDLKYAVEMRLKED